MPTQNNNNTTFVTKVQDFINQATTQKGQKLKVIYFENNMDIVPFLEMLEVFTVSKVVDHLADFIIKRSRKGVATFVQTLYKEGFLKVIAIHGVYLYYIPGTAQEKIERMKQVYSASSRDAREELTSSSVEQST